VIRFIIFYSSIQISFFIIYLIVWKIKTIIRTFKIPKPKYATYLKKLKLVLWKISIVAIEKAEIGNEYALHER